MPPSDNRPPVPGFNRLPGFYLGTVVKHLPHGKCKVFIYGVHDESWIGKPDMLPSAVQMTPLFGGGIDGNGVFSLPCIGATVVCAFLNGDQNMPMIMGQFLGGQNAFGQYDLLLGKKLSSDQLSDQLYQEIYDRHLVTAGESQLELFEKGKISAIVSDPIRTDATVKYGNSDVMDEQDDEVLSRPICEQVANNEISNIYCKTVLDNDAGCHGSLSGLTHFYDTYKINTLSIYDSPAQVSDITEVQSHILTSLVENNEHYLNSGNVAITTISSSNKTDLTSTISSSTQETFISADNFTHDHKAGYQSDIDGQSKIYNQGKKSEKHTYTYYNNQDKHTINKNLLKKDESDARICVDKDGSGAITSGCKENITSSFVDSQKPLATVYFKSENKYDDGLEFSKKSLSLDQYKKEHTIVATPLMPQTIINDKLICDNNIEMQDGIWAQGSYNHKVNITYSSGLAYQKKVKNESSIDMPITEDKVQNNRLAKYYYKTVSQNGAVEIYDMQLSSCMDASNGSIIIKVLDNRTKNESTIELDSQGGIYIRGSSVISLTAPHIQIRGSSVDIEGASGDCKIKNVSLLDHKHIEMQSGDIVTAGGTSTQTATASN